MTRPAAPRRRQRLVDSDAWRAFWTLAAITALLAFGIGVALTGVTDAVPKDSAATASPLGYTRSLVLFIAPIIALLGWFARHPQTPFARKAVLITVALLTPLGILLDFLFARQLLRFERPATTLGIPFPVLGTSAAIESVPIEEVIFYMTGFFAVLLTYVWADEYWLSRYNVPDLDGKRARSMTPLLSWDWRAVYAGVAVALAGTLWKWRVDGEIGYPLYLYFLVVAAVIPTGALLESTVSFINWRAFSFTYLAILLVSLVWEVTLAMPYGWWDYQLPQMVGINIYAWWKLPIEAVLVWLAVTYATVVVYEAVKMWQVSGRSARQALVGDPASRQAKRASRAAASQRRDAPAPSAGNDGAATP